MLETLHLSFEHLMVYKSGQFVTFTASFLATLLPSQPPPPSPCEEGNREV